MDNREFGELVTSASILHLGRGLNNHSNSGVEEELNDNINNFLFLSEELLTAPVRHLLKTDPEQVWNLIKIERNAVVELIARDVMDVDDEENSMWYPDFFKNELSLNSFFAWYIKTCPRPAANTLGTHMRTGNIDNAQFYILLNSFRKCNKVDCEILKEIVESYVESISADGHYDIEARKLFFQLYNYDLNVLKIIEELYFKYLHSGKQKYFDELSRLRLYCEAEMNKKTHYDMGLV